MPLPASRKCSIQSHLEEVPTALEMVLSMARETGFADDAMLRIELAVEEALVNICSYAYSGGEGTVEISTVPEDGYMTVSLSDQGAEFDPLAAEMPDTDAEESTRRVGGLGILLIGKMAESVSYSRKDDRNILIMRFAA